MVLGKLDIYMQKNEIKTPLSPHTKINSKYIKELMIKICNYETTVRNTGEMLHELSWAEVFCIDFLNF